ncbi:hypothetical protein [Streptomyces sp. NPDC093568]|uniref:hypothetical protein n=1 Tax=Streptomyces sp. NPDC093568 TaxID=3366041 RepID=UPI0038179D08
MRKRGNRVHHPRERRPAATPPQPRPPRGQATGIRPADHRRRNIAERCFNRLEDFRGIATRYHKTATSYEAAVSPASFLLWERSV